jgi:hypothetical protein
MNGNEYLGCGLMEGTSFILPPDLQRHQVASAARSKQAPKKKNTVKKSTTKKRSSGARASGANATTSSPKRKTRRTNNGGRS